jgi:hypothetical protein
MLWSAVGAEYGSMFADLALGSQRAALRPARVPVLA